MTAQLDAHPVSWSLDDEIDVNLAYVTLPEVNEGALMLEDQTLNENKDHPYRFAFKHQVNLSLLNSGRWVTLSNGDRIWMLGIESEDALSLALTFSEFELPKGSVLYMYKPDRSSVIGPFSSANNKSTGIFTTNHLEGSQLILEYYEPYNARNDGKLKIRTVAHAYRTVETGMRDYMAASNCNINTICDVNSAWMNQVSSVVRLTVDDGSRWCTGVMLNNAAQDGRPLLLMSETAVMGDPESFVANFNFQSNTCSPSSFGKLKNTISGMTLLETSHASGLALLELSLKPLSSWDVFYSGWDRSGQVPESVTSIHHPKGDVKKIASDLQMPSMDIFQNKLVWATENWDEGMVEAGSVGAPLFDENGRVHGSLLGGTGDCSTGSDESFYGKLSLAWDDFEKHLNPHNLNISKLDGLFPDYYVVDFDLLQENVAVFPNPANDHITVINENAEGLVGLSIFDTSGRPVMEINYLGGPVNIDHLDRGAYLVVIQLESFQVKQQLVVY